MRRVGRTRRIVRTLVALVVGLIFPCMATNPCVAIAEGGALANRKAPNFTRVDLDHTKVRLKSYRGNVVLLNFWATWCAPCRSEMPHFAEWQRRYGGPRGLRVIGVSLDDDEAPVRAFYRECQLNYPVVMGDEKLGERYGGIFGLPVTLLIDRDGNIRFDHHGATDLDVIEREIQQLLPRP